MDPVTVTWLCVIYFFINKNRQIEKIRKQEIKKNNNKKIKNRGSMDPVYEGGPWTRSKEGVHLPGVHDLSSPLFMASLR